MPKFSFADGLKTEYKHLDTFAIPSLIAGILVANIAASVSVGFSLLIIALLAFPFLRIFKPLIGLVFFFAIGFTAMSYRQSAVMPTLLEKPLYDLEISGIVDEASPLPNGQRITLSAVHFLNEPFMQTPERVRLKYVGDMPLLLPGTKMQATVFLRPLHSPLLPGDYNEKGLLKFERIGAVGVVKQVVTTEEPLPTVYSRLEQVRMAIRDRLLAYLPSETAHLAVPLILGDQGVVSPHLYHAFRSAGITHILSVSGFHLSLLTIFVFLLLRKIFSFFPRVSDRLVGKKIAVLCALLCAIGYVTLSGMRVPALRALIMVMVVVVGVLFERNTFSVRSLSVAAFVLLVFRPELVFYIGFQLSFMAVLVLITLYPKIKTFLFPERPCGMFNRLLRLITGFVLANLLITMATLPIVIQHFNLYTPYGLLGNALTGTLFAFWVLPLLFVSLLMMPFGGEALFLGAAGIGLEYIINISCWIDGLSGALIPLASFSGGALILMMSGLVVLCLMRTSLRIVGVPVILIGMIWAFLTPRPDLLLGDGGLTIAVRQDGQLYFLAQAPSDETARHWLLKNGEVKIRKLSFQTPLVIKGKKIAFSDTDCIRADLCFLPNPMPQQPNALPRYISQPYAVYIRNDQISVKNP